MADDELPDLPENLWAWLTITPEGTWSQVGAMLGDHHTPLTFVNERIAHSQQVREIALEHLAITGQPVFLVRFGRGELEERLQPDRPS